MKQWEGEKVIQMSRKKSFHIWMDIMVLHCTGGNEQKEKNYICFWVGVVPTPEQLEGQFNINSDNVVLLELKRVGYHQNISVVLGNL